MAEKEPRLQGNEDVESGRFSTEEDEFFTFMYLLEGKIFSISKESQETLDCDVRLTMPFLTPVKERQTWKK